MIHTPELLIVLSVLLLLFGANRLPKLARSLGQARRELLDAGSEVRASPDQRRT